MLTLKKCSCEDELLNLLILFSIVIKVSITNKASTNDFKSFDIVALVFHQYCNYSTVVTILCALKSCGENDHTEILIPQIIFGFFNILYLLLRKQLTILCS